MNLLRILNMERVVNMPSSQRVDYADYLPVVSELNTLHALHSSLLMELEFYK